MKGERQWAGWQGKQKGLILKGYDFARISNGRCFLSNEKTKGLLDALSRIIAELKKWDVGIPTPDVID